MQTVFALVPLFASELDIDRGWFPWPVALVLGILSVAAVGALYVLEIGRIGVAARVAMAVVRAAIVLVVAALLLRPVWVTEEKGSKPRPIAVLIDISQSMDRDDPRPNNDDQWRTALAFGLTDADKGLPRDPVLSLIPREKLPEKPKRIDVARAALTNPKIDFFKRLAKAGPLEIFTFGENRIGRDATNEEWLKTVAANEPRTALVESAFSLLNRDDTDAPAAIVIVTDGRENTGPRSLDDLARECNRRKIPIHIYGVGSSAYGQLETAFGGAASDKNAGVTRAGADIDVPNTLFVDDVAAVPVRYTVKGVLEGTATVVLKYGERVVDTKKETFTLTAEEMKAGKTFTQVMKFVPTKQDAASPKQEYSATVTLTSGGGAGSDTVTAQISRPAQVVDRKLKLLWVDSKPRRDFEFLQRSLLRDRRIDAKFYLTEGDRAAMRSGPPWMVDFSREIDGTLNMDKDEFRKTLFAFDLLVLGDVPGKYFNTEQQKIIKEFVIEGGGLIQIAGRWHAPADFANDKTAPPTAPKNPISEVLPVEFDKVLFSIEVPESPTGFVPVLSAAAARTQIVSLEDDLQDNADTWGKPGPPAVNPSDKQLKPMYWYYPVTKVKPAADVFLTHPTALMADKKPMPLLVGHHFGKGYVLFVGFDDTWRWRFNNQDRLSGKFWTQAIYTAGVPRIVGTKQTQISSNALAPVKGTTGEVYVRVFNESFQPFTAEEIEGTLENLDADPNASDRFVTVKFRKVGGADGEYVTSLAYNKVGQFRLKVDPKNKSPAELKYTVVYPDTHELAPGALDEDAMRKLARDSRNGGDGGFYREENLITLPDEVKPLALSFSHRHETLLWNEYAMILLIVLLSLEWLLRKLNGLS